MSSLLLLVAIAWGYVVVLMALAEGTSDGGTWLGAFFTFVLYGVLPLGIALYLLATPLRRGAARRRAAVGETEVSAPRDDASVATVDPDGGGHASGDAVATERKEP